MRVLLDEQLPRPLAGELVGHDARTVQSQRWAGLKNGDLLERAIDDGFDVFLTADTNLEFQQNLVRYEIAVIVVRPRSNDFDDLRPLVPKILAALETAKPGNVVHVAA